MKLQTAKGVRDLPPEEKILKNKVVSTITRYFELYGFAPLETPILERYETLEAKYGAGTGSEVLKETFKLKDQGKRELGLRFEMTTSLARFVAQNPNLKMPFKAYQIGSIFRDGPIKLGRDREFWQADADTIGSSSMLAEAEQIAILADVFTELKFNFVIKVNNRKLLNGLLMQAGITKKTNEALIAVDKLGKIGKAGVSEELKGIGFDKGQISRLMDLLSKKYNMLSKDISNPQWNEGKQEIEELLKYLKTMKLDKSVELDLTLVRGQAYYTGTVIEAYLRKSSIASSIAAGGRYDSMVRGLKGESGLEVPAAGVSFGLTPIIEQIKLQNELKVKTLAKVLVIPINTVEKSLMIIQELRQKGISASFALGKGVSKNLEYAGSLGIPYVLIIGEREIKEDKVLLRNMETGEETLLKVDKVIKLLHEK